MTIVRTGFTQLVGNAFGSFGLPTEAPYVMEFPHALFFENSDMTPLRENLDKIVYGLTKWQPKITKKGVYYPGENLKVQGLTYQDALENFNHLFLQKLWGDGLPLIPPTKERVAWIMTGTDQPFDAIVPGCGRVDPRGGVAAVGSMAICLAMAGGRPEYFPVFLAIVEAMTQTVDTDPTGSVSGDWNLAAMAATTRSTFPAFIVSGTIANQIRLGSGYGLLGPDPRHPASGPIGRAVRLTMQALGGSVAGIGTMSMYGGMRFTNAIFAEDEEGLPKGWKSLGEWRGFARGANAVTGEPIGHFESINLSTTAPSILETLAGAINRPTGSRPTRKDPDLSNGFMIFPDGAAKVLADAGYTREAVRQYMFEKSGNFASTPEQILFVVGGGEQAQHTYKMTASKQDSRVSRAIKLPKNWDALLAQAEKDLGPNPGHTM